MNYILFFRNTNIVIFSVNRFYLTCLCRMYANPRVSRNTIKAIFHSLFPLLFCLTCTIHYYFTLHYFSAFLFGSAWSPKNAYVRLSMMLIKGLVVQPLASRGLGIFTPFFVFCYLYELSVWDL